MKTFCLILALIGAFASASTATAARPRIPIDEVPMYGGMDRQAEPVLRQADADFIAQTSAAFGGREKAAQAWVEQGFKFYKSNQPEMAMKRFNQAWLLDPRNPEVYWGFGAVLHDGERAHEAYDMMKRAYDLGWRDAGFLADFGKVATVRTVEKKNLPAARRREFVAEGERYFEEAKQAGRNAGYVHTIWASAKYWSGDYAGAWEQVKQARASGAPDNAKFLALLSQKMREPK
jgi:Tfp pilus assembly protein PilF